MADLRCNERRREAGLAAPRTCRRCGLGPCTSTAPAVEPPALRPPSDEPEQAAAIAADEDGGLHELLCDIAAYLGDQPARRDQAAGALYRRVMAMLGGKEAE